MGPLSPVALQCPGGLGGRRLSQFLQPTSLGAPALWRSGPGSLLPPRPPRISLIPMSTQAEPLPSCPLWSTLTQESVGLPMSILPSLPALCLYEGSMWPLALAAWSSSFLPYILYAQLPLCLWAFPIPLTLAHAAPPFQQTPFTLGLQHLVPSKEDSWSL